MKTRYLNKEDFRKECKKQLKFQSQEFAKCKHYSVLNHIESILKNNIKTHFPNKDKHNLVKNIMIFLPLKTEVNMELFSKKFSHKYNFYVPFMSNVSFKLVKLSRPFKKVKFGLTQPLDKNAFNRKIDIAIVPVLGVDGNMARIGHGKGYYDMFFDKLHHKPMIIFTEIKCMKIENIVSQSHDIQGKIYITPTKNYISRGKNDRNRYWFSSRYNRYRRWLFGSKKDKRC